jgi:hypothetical protein
MKALSSERHFSDAGASVNLVNVSKELALFFKLDKDEVRQGLKMQEMLCCDGLIFYSHDSEQEKVFCLVELKASDLEHAVKQIVTTRDHLKQGFAKTFARSYFEQVTWKAYIYYRSTAPTEIKIYRSQLENTYSFGEGNADISRNSDIGDFLRRKAKHSRKGPR